MQISAKAVVKIRQKTERCNPLCFCFIKIFTLLFYSCIIFLVINLEAKLIQEYTLRESDFDCNGRIRISAVLELFQDIAGHHATLLSCSGDDMIKKGLLWVLVNVKIRILQQPHKHSTVKLVTWPLEQKGIRFGREYKVFNQDGELIILGSSKWAFIDLHTRKLARASDVYPVEFEYCTEKTFEQDDRTPDFDTPDNCYVVTPKFTHLDSNGHVNNTKYADFIMDALFANDKPPSVTELQIDYKSEVLYNEQLNLAYKHDGYETYFKGTDQNGQIKFTAKIIEA